MGEAQATLSEEVIDALGLMSGLRRGDWGLGNTRGRVIHFFLLERVLQVLALAANQSKK